MWDRKALWQVSAAAAALAIGLLVYLVDRPALAVFVSAGPVVERVSVETVLFGDLGRSLPSLVHVYAFILLSAALLPRRRLPLLATCVGWFTLESLFEMGQLPGLATRIDAWLPAWVDGLPLLGLVRPYFLNGTFDPLDILALALGALAAWASIGFIWKSHHERIHH